MAFRARLDHDQVYWGPEEVDELGPDDVAAPDDAIRPGAYRWQPAKDGDVGHFVPLTPHQVKHAETGPTLEQAFYDLTEMVMAMDPMFAVPARVTAWREWFEKTLDEKVKG